jgi:hypothetical protein
MIKCIFFPKLFAPCSFGLSATSHEYFSLRTNQSPATSQQYFSLRTNQHQPSATSQTNRLLDTRTSYPHAPPPADIFTVEVLARVQITTSWRSSTSLRQPGRTRRCSLHRLRLWAPSSILCRLHARRSRQQRGTSKQAALRNRVEAWHKTKAKAPACAHGICAPQVSDDCNLYNGAVAGDSASGNEPTPSSRRRGCRRLAASGCFLQNIQHADGTNRSVVRAPHPARN